MDFSNSFLIEFIWFLPEILGIDPNPILSLGSKEEQGLSMILVAQGLPKSQSLVVMIRVHEIYFFFSKLIQSLVTSSIS
jgi:hypothetical protein